MGSHCREPSQIGRCSRAAGGGGPFACYYHSMCQAVYNRLQAALAVDRRTVHSEERHQAVERNMLDQ